MRRTDNPEVLARCFAALERAAVQRLRCPENGTPDMAADVVRELARLGRIRVEIYTHNWRVVVIMDGPNKGSRTAERPGDLSPPWKVIDKNGSRTNGRPRDVGASKRQQPSPPRLLSKRNR